MWLLVYNICINNSRCPAQELRNLHSSEKYLNVFAAVTYPRGGSDGPSQYVPVTYMEDLDFLSPGFGSNPVQYL